MFGYIFLDASFPICDNPFSVYDNIRLYKRTEGRGYLVSFVKGHRERYMVLLYIAAYLPLDAEVYSDKIDFASVLLI